MLNWMKQILELIWKRKPRRKLRQKLISLYRQMQLSPILRLTCLNWSKGCIQWLWMPKKMS